MITCIHCNNGYCFDCGYVFEVLSPSEQIALEIEAFRALLEAQQTLTDSFMATYDFSFVRDSFNVENMLQNMLNTACFELKIIDIAQTTGF